MPDRPILLVCGQGRCGTSLVMQMLQEMGVSVTGTHPTFEHMPPCLSPAGSLDRAAYWRQNYGGAAIKILDPHLNRPPAELQYRAIWLDRDFTQQAMSQLKFLSAMGVAAENHPKAVKKLAKKNVATRQLAVTYLMSLARPENCIATRFEHLINAPFTAAQQIFDHFKSFKNDSPEHDAEVVLRMGNVVRFRHPDNYDGLLELNL